MSLSADGADLSPSAGDGDARPYGLLGLGLSFVLILIAALALTVLAALVAFAIAGLALGWQTTLGRLVDLQTSIGSDLTLLQRAGVVISVVVYAAASIAVLAAARFRGGVKWRALVGWHRWSPARGARRFWLVTAATIVYGFVADALVSRFYPPSQDWISVPVGPVWVGLFIVLAIVLAPLTEELLFRGWLYTGLRPKIGVWPAILLTAALFALAHWEKTHLYAVGVLPVGVGLGYVRERCGSLFASMTLHALFNGAASLALLFGQ